MFGWMNILERRRQLLRCNRWLPFVLRGVDGILLIFGFLITDGILGLIIAVLPIVLNEIFSPILIHKIFFKELGATIPMSGDLTTKRISPAVSAETRAQERKDNLIGTPFYDNWIEFRNHAKLLTKSEYPLYSDASLTDELSDDSRPQQFLNLVPTRGKYKGKGYVTASLILRIGIYKEFEFPSMGKIEQSRYHGGSMADEITALASLLCGVRFRAGNATRWFTEGGDPLGQPAGWGERDEPTLSILNNGYMLPDLMEQHSIAPLKEMDRFPSLTPDAAIVLVRAARLYQDALWLAESEPNLSWLLLVSAVETVATLWNNSDFSPLEKLRVSQPDFVEYLTNTGIDDLPERVANQFADSIGCTKKFVEFLIKFLPDPPQKRPPQIYQISWVENDLRKAFKLVYSYRSKALHDARPFPAPMCWPVFGEPEWDANAERMPGDAISTLTGRWQKKDIPMSLHIFEYIVRNALIAWWRSQN